MTDKTDLDYKEQKETNNFDILKKTGGITSEYNSIISDLFNNEDISEEKFNEIKEESHLYLAKSLYGFVPGIENYFLSGKKTLNSCYRHDTTFPIMALLTLVFSSYKEQYLGKKGNSRENMNNRINFKNKEWLNYSEGVKIYKAPENLSDKQLIIEIRNALEHTQYAILGNGLYIHNPKDIDQKKHAYDFIAFIPFDCLNKFILSCGLVSHKRVVIAAESLKSIKLNQHLNLDNIDFIKGVVDINDAEIKTSKILLNSYSKEIIGDYLNKHKLDSKNIGYIGQSLIEPADAIMREVLIKIATNPNKGFNINVISEDVFNEYYYNQLFNFETYFDISNKSEKDQILKSICRNLCSKKQPNGQPLLKHLTGCTDYINQYLIKKLGFTLDDKKSIYKKGNIEIPTKEITEMITPLIQIYDQIIQDIKAFPQWLKIQSIRYTYINELLPIVKDSEDEHIRNALAHNQYFMLEGVDDILLYDTYNKKTDTYEREKKYSLSELYKDTYNKITTQN